MPKAQSVWSRAYNEKAYDRGNFVVPKGRMQDIRVYMEAHNTTINAFINDALRNALGMDETQWKARPTSDDQTEQQTDQDNNQDKA